MAEKLKVELQDEKGNIYYLHTDASIVFCADGTSVAAKLNNKLDTTRIVNNGACTEPGFALDARYGKTLREGQERLNSDLTAKISGNSTILATFAASDIGKNKAGINFKAYKALQIEYIVQQQSNGNMFFNTHTFYLVGNVTTERRYLSHSGNGYAYSANTLLSLDYNAGSVNLVDFTTGSGFVMNGVYIFGIR